MPRQVFTVEFETHKFNQSLRRFVRNVETDRVPVAIKKWAFELLRRIMLKTPVDTGRARAAWYASAEGLGMRFDFTSGSRQYDVAGTTYGATRRRRAGTGGVQQGIREGQFIDNLRGLRPYVEMINGCPYIIYLEYGWSRQSPTGMVRVSMREMTGERLPQDLGRGVRAEWNRFFWGSR